MSSKGKPLTEETENYRHELNRLYLSKTLSQYDRYSFKNKADVEEAKMQRLTQEQMANFKPWFMETYREVSQMSNAMLDRLDLNTVEVYVPTDGYESMNNSNVPDVLLLGVTLPESEWPQHYQDLEAINADRDEEDQIYLGGAGLGDMFNRVYSNRWREKATAARDNRVQNTMEDRSFSSTTNV